MVLGWIDLFKRHFMRPHEFVSADAKRISLTAQHAGTSSPYSASHITKYDVLALASPQIHSEVASPQPALTSPPGSRAGRSPLPSGHAGTNSMEKTDYFGREAKYTSPVTSFSSPRPPSANAAYGSVTHDRTHSFTHRSWSLTAAGTGGPMGLGTGSGPGPAWGSPGRDRTATFSSLGVPKEVKEWER